MNSQGWEQSQAEVTLRGLAPMTRGTVPPQAGAAPCQAFPSVVWRSPEAPVKIICSCEPGALSAGGWGGGI